MDTPPDFSLVWTWDNGSVPPRYRKSRHVTIDAEGRMVQETRHGYGDDDMTRTTASIDLDALAEGLVSVGLFDIGWAETERVKIGGGGSRLRVTWNGREVVVPRYPAEDQRDAKEELEAFLRDALP